MPTRKPNRRDLLIGRIKAGCRHRLETSSAWLKILEDENYPSDWVLDNLFGDLLEEWLDIRSLADNIQAGQELENAEAFLGTRLMPPRGRRSLRMARAVQDLKMLAAEYEKLRPLLREALTETLGAELPGKQRPPVSRMKRQERRRKIIKPLLRERGWSLLKWAKESDVSEGTVKEYMSGKTLQLKAENRTALAAALGIEPARLDVV
jgi:lambda repressor-like predicted transcriptional regulator